MSEEEDKKELERKLESLFNGLNAGLKVLSQVREVYDEKMAFEFNSLNFLEPNENKISQIIAFFLDPHQVHGQKNSFLRIFLNNVLPDSERVQTEILLKKNIKVTTQYYTSNGRPIDIVIQFGNNDFLIGIENKVWGACDQARQIYEYAYDLKEKSNGKYLLLYFSRNGEPPCEESITEVERKDLGESFQIRGFNLNDVKNSIITLFCEFEKVCMADNVRGFIKEFIKYLKTEFISGENIMGENDFIKDFMSKDGNMELALKVLYSNAEQEIKEKLWKKVANDVKKFADNNGLICEPIQDINDLTYPNATFISFRKSKWEKTTAIDFRFEKNSMQNCYFGLIHKSEKLLYGLSSSIDLLGFKYVCVSDSPQEWTSHCTEYYDKYPNWDLNQPWLDMIPYNSEGESIFLTDLFDKVSKVLKCAEIVAEELQIEL